MRGRFLGNTSMAIRYVDPMLEFSFSSDTASTIACDGPGMHLCWRIYIICIHPQHTHVHTSPPLPPTHPKEKSTKSSVSSSRSEQPCHAEHRGAYCHFVCEQLQRDQSQREVLLAIPSLPWLLLIIGSTTVSVSKGR